MTIKTEKVLGSELKAGNIVRNHGYRWMITSIEYDPRGNTGISPRYLVNAYNLEEGEPYCNGGMVMGLSVDLHWNREV